MKCEKAEQLILLQSSGEMAEKMTHPLAAHLHDCDPCRQFQHALIESEQAFHSAEEPPVKIIQNILREVRQNVPEKKTAKILTLRPMLAMAASLLIALGLFFTVFSPDQVGMELVVTETQLLNSTDQIVSVMYEGLSEDDLTFNFLMTYEGNG